MADDLTPVTHHLELVQVGDHLAVEDGQPGTLLELLPASDIPGGLRPVGPPPPALIGLADALVASSPHVLAMVERVRASASPTTDLVVRFAPHIAERLQDGTAKLMMSNGQAMAKAFDRNTGRFLETAKVVGPAAASSATGGAAGGAAAGGAAVAAGAGGAAVILPVAIAGGAALAASWAQQRWLEQTLGGLQRALDRVETRLRDDDLGALAAADSIVDLIGDRAAFGDIGEQVCSELAIARFRTESIFKSRLRFVEQFKKDLEAWQVEAEKATGQPVTWTKEIVETLVADDSATVAELVVFFQALLTRCRLASVTAALLVTQGDPLSAFALTDEIRSSIRHDYFDLHNRLAALGRSDFKSGGLRQVLGSKERKKARQIVGDLAGTLDRSIGDHLPSPDEQLELRIPIEAFAR